MRSESARALLELIIALIIALPLLLGITQTSTHFAKSLHTIKLKTSQIYIETKVQNEIGTITEQLDLHRLNIPPRIHTNGRITYSNGAPNPVSLRTDLLKPSRSSDAITTYTLSGIQELRIVDTDYSAIPTIFYTCLAYDLTGLNLKKIQDHEIFVGITTAGYVELTGSAIAWNGVSGKKCYAVALSTNDGMIGQKNSLHHLPFIKLLFPVDRIYTLYIDQVGRLRYLGHRGILNIENQPILEGVNSLNLSLDYFPLPAHIRIKSTLKLPNNNKPLITTSVSKLGRLTNFNFLYN